MTTKEALCGALIELIELYPKACEARDRLSSLADSAIVAHRESKLEAGRIFGAIAAINELLPPELRQLLPQRDDPDHIPY